MFARGCVCRFKQFISGVVGVNGMQIFSLPKKHCYRASYRVKKRNFVVEVNTLWQEFLRRWSTRQLRNWF